MRGRSTRVTISRLVQLLSGPDRDMKIVGSASEQSLRPSKSSTSTLLMWLRRVTFLMPAELPSTGRCCESCCSNWLPILRQTRLGFQDDFEYCLSLRLRQSCEARALIPAGEDFPEALIDTIP